MRLEDYLKEAEGLAELEKWGKTFGENHGKMPDEKGFFDLCVEHMSGKIDDPKAYCARVKDAFNNSTYWRGKDKPKGEVESDVKKHPLKEDIDEMVKKYIFSCKACEYVKKCKFKVMTDTIPEDCPMKRG